MSNRVQRYFSTIELGYLTWHIQYGTVCIRDPSVKARAEAESGGWHLETDCISVSQSSLASLLKQILNDVPISAGHFTLVSSLKSS
ncbi:unnamed protein product, partial [Clonostachys rosea f. rosea IK726]